MITITKGNMLLSDVEALVNTVNCVGYMGKGIALQFKKAFPDNFKAYERACRAEEVHPGKMFVFETGALINPKYVINFPTKRHWKGKSLLEDVASGLVALVEEIKSRHVQTIAVPPLGCGLGGLPWKTVRPMIEDAFSAAPDVHVLLYEPTGSPDARTMPVRTSRPNMTPARALFLKLMQGYSEFAYRLTLLELQKLAYFLQEAGEPLRLKYEAGRYGPYAHNLNKVLEILEGHFIRGYGDTQKPDVEIDLMEGAVEEADAFIAHHPDSYTRLERVARLIEGFETPYGMELLSSAHWVASHDEHPAVVVEDVVKKVHEWNDRKRRMFQVNHIRVAFERLSNENWVGQLNSA